MISKISFTIISIFNDLPKNAKQNKQNVQNDKMFNIFIAGFLVDLGCARLL
jgi:hypothetical protein